jgi:2-dehydro-3-deoxyphosphooctonate aldolase (KDO 8-P synthase)
MNLNRLFLIAGPCVIESAELCLTIARHVKAICERLEITYIFKASFDKANRSSVSGFRGPGLHDGLAVLRRVKEELDLPVLTDIHEAEQVPHVAKIVDILQIPAFLARQTDLLIAAGHSGRAVNIKKGQFMSPQEMGNAVEKVKASRAGLAAPPPIMLTERGTFFGYNRLVNDFTSIPIMKSFGVPVIFDATHSTQQPAALGGSSGGNPQFTPLLAHAAIAAGVDGLFIETHPEPAKARSDASTMIPLSSVEALLTQCKTLYDLRRSWL